MSIFPTLTYGALCDDGHRGHPNPAGKRAGDDVGAHDATLIAFACAAARHMQQRAAAMAHTVAELDLAQAPGPARASARTKQIAA